MVKKDANGKTLSKKSRAQIKDMTGMIFERLTVIGLDHVDNHGNAYWKCKCKCGNEKIVQRWNLLSGNVRSCGCLNKEQRYKTKHFVNIPAGSVFGRLTTTGNHKKRVTSSKTDELWECECLCGNITWVKGYALKSGHTNSCGCLKSKMELDINIYLNSRNELNNINQVQFDDLKLISNLIFDFGLCDKDWNLICLIECQGYQHFNEKCGEFGRLQREVTDLMKKEYCKEKAIPLYYINYNENILERIQLIYDNAVRSLDKKTRNV